jgi:S1-C subfamily serine protease
LPDDNRGILVANVSPGGSVDGKLQKGDIVVALDDHPVFSNGQVKIDGQMVNMHEVVERKYSGDKVVIDFLRGGKKDRVEATLAQFAPARIFATEYETRPTYAVFGGLVFQPFSRNLLAAYGFDSLEVRHLLERYTADALYQDRDDIIMLTQVLPDTVNTELASLGGLIVEEINGKKVGSMKDIMDLLLNPLEKGELPEFVVIRCRGTERPLVLDGKAMKEAQARIRSKYGLTRDYLLEGRAGDGLNW